MTREDTLEPWEELRTVLGTRDGERLVITLERLGPAETARAISRLERDEQTSLLKLLDPPAAADLIEEMPETQAADLIEDLPARDAAAIVDRMHSDEQADILARLTDEDAGAIIGHMSPEEAEDVKHLLAYPPDSAGGIMITEYLAYDRDRSVAEVIEDLRTHSDVYADFDVQYLYVKEADGRLAGVLRTRDLLYSDRKAALGNLVRPGVHAIHVSDSIETMKQFFEHNDLFGAPVVDDRRRLVGVVLPEDIEEAAGQETSRQFLGFSGIVGGEEFRSMPLRLRSGRRLSWLSMNIVLNVVAASVIAIYQDTISAVIALAVFLPIISDMSGCSGNQAVAVSMRELALGLVRTHEVRRVLLKEAALGAINGLVLGTLLGAVGWVWKGNPWLGLVVGAALVLNTVLAAALGGALPLILKRARVDPALVSSPLLTTVTDMFGFFILLSLATALLPRLTG